MENDPSAATPRPLDPRAATAAATAELRKVVVGQDRVVERLMACLLSGGHALLEGVPGVGKTVLLSTLATVVGGSFSRIQFTADLMPSDIVGTRMWRASNEDFTVERGPVFANFVLADEVNRAPAKVQSALLEVMAERQVTLGGESHRMPQPFLVLATQNPIDSEGTYPLPEAQRDRFMMRIMVGYPSGAEEWEIMRRHAAAPPTASRVLDPGTVVELQRRAEHLTLPDPVARYALDLVLATREPAAYGMPELAGRLAYGASPRASLALVRASRGIALLRGQGEVTAQDVYDVAYDVLNHRLVLSYKALSDGVEVDDVLRELLSTVRAPAPVQHAPAVATGHPQYGAVAGPWGANG